MTECEPRIHPSALVEEGATIGPAAQLWHQVHVRRGAHIGARCILGKGAFVDVDVAVGDDCKIQNYACVYHGVTLGRGVFVGPHAVFANDKRPRAVGKTFAQLTDADWEVGATIVDDGASIGANATILPGVRIGSWAMVAAGAVVTKDVASYSLVAGSPARHSGWLCPCGHKVTSGVCTDCGPLPNDHPLASATP